MIRDGNSGKTAPSSIEDSLNCSKGKFTLDSFVRMGKPTLTHNADFPEIDISVTNDPIDLLLNDHKVVFTSNGTSAAVDAYCTGKSVVTVLDPKSLNLSPLKSSEGVSFVSSPEALAAVLNRMGQMKEVEGQGKNYFYLDTNFSRWKRLLKQSRNSELKLN